MAEEDKQGRRVKSTDASAHRTGTLRGAVKPHKRQTGPDIEKIINDYMATVRKGTLTQTTYGASVAKAAQTLQANFGLSTTDVPYLLLDVTGRGAGKAGMVLSKNGIYLADGRGGTASTTWSEFASQKVGYQRGMLVIGQNGITTTDGQVLAGLLQKIQSNLTK